jgi:putative endonuclease
MFGGFLLIFIIQIAVIMKGYAYILRCYDDRLYVGSTNNLEKRIKEHLSGIGSNFTKIRLPVELVFVEEFKRVDQAFYREKQIQRWTRAKKEALILGYKEELHRLAECKNKTHYLNKKNPSNDDKDCNKQISKSEE